MRSIGWLRDASEDSLRSALAAAVPALSGLPLSINPWHPLSNPLWWSASAVVAELFIVKYAWSEARAERLWREGKLLERLGTQRPRLPVPEVVAVTEDPALVVTRLSPGAPLSWEWTDRLTAIDIDVVAEQLAAFLVRLHGIDVTDLLADLPVVQPKAQADTERLRTRFPRLVDKRRSASVLQWCEWVDEVLGVEAQANVGVVVHGDLHGYNQLWEHESATLLAVVDFEESGVADPHFDLRYLPGTARTPDLAVAVLTAYERLSGRTLAVERMMAWNVLTVLGDALWRTEAGVVLPGGGTASTWVDDLERRLVTLELA